MLGSGEMTAAALVLTGIRWLAGESVGIRTRSMALAALALSSSMLIYAAGVSWGTIKPIAKAKQAVLPPDQGDVRFGVPLKVRHAVFAQLAGGEPEARRKGKASFDGPGLEWSAEDHRGAFERHNVAAVATQFGLSLTQIYLILDEGIREHWLGPDGVPLDPKTVPLNPRRKYG